MLSATAEKWHRRVGIFLMATVSFFLAACASAPDGTDGGASKKFSYVYPGWKDARDFKRISEYFSDGENDAGNIVRRTNPDVREGMYFLIGLPHGLKFSENAVGVLEYFRSDSQAVFEREFLLPKSPARPLAELRLGLTGDDWDDPKLRLVAWRVTLKSDTGAILAQSQSFLWSLPKNAE